MNVDASLFNIFIIHFSNFLFSVQQLDDEVKKLIDEVKKLFDRAQEYQQENIMMFTRIMEKLRSEPSSQDNDVSLTHADINVKNFPCSDFDEMKRLNTLCKGDPLALKILV